MKQFNKYLYLGIDWWNSHLKNHTSRHGSKVQQNEIGGGVKVAQIGEGQVVVEAVEKSRDQIEHKQARGSFVIGFQFCNRVIEENISESYEQFAAFGQNDHKCHVVVIGAAGILKFQKKSSYVPM